LTLKFTRLENVLKPAQPAKMVYSFVNPRQVSGLKREVSAASNGKHAHKPRYSQIVDSSR
jgi:hypothetical protein